MGGLTVTRSILICSVCALLLACGDDAGSSSDNDAGNAGNGPSASGSGGSRAGSGGSRAGSGGSRAGSGGASSSGAGTLTVTIEDITGARGKVLVAMAFPQGGSAGGGPSAAVCGQITEDPQTLTLTFETPTAPNNPCMTDGEATLDAGTYSVDTSVFMPGSMTAEQCARFDVDLDGDTRVTAPALGTDC
jgi:hypothetical protein